MKKETKKLAKGIIKLADPKIWIASTVPMILGTVLAFAYGDAFHLGWILVAFTVVYLIETGKNAINEVVDYYYGADRFIDEEHRNAFSGGKKTIIDGLLTTGQALIIFIITMVLACVLGILIIVFKEPKLFFIGGMGVILATLYSLPPFKLCYRGLGEITVGFIYGPLILNGMYLMLTGRLDVLPLLLSVNVGLLIANVLWINQFPDYEADKRAGKHNLVVRLGKKKSAVVYGIIFLTAYLMIPIISLYGKSLVWFVGLSTVPLAVKSVKNCNRNYENIKGLLFSNGYTVKIYALNGLLIIIAVLYDWLIKSGGRNI